MILQKATLILFLYNYIKLGHNITTSTLCVYKYENAALNISCEYSVYVT